MTYLIGVAFAGISDYTTEYSIIDYLFSGMVWILLIAFVGTILKKANIL